MHHVRVLADFEMGGLRGARGERQDRDVIRPLDRPPPPYTP
ncbi:MAG TPA: hypothetical protein VES79_00115 [Solirubrobacteraceae bacterium]|nr:hypothetical protein [Solirubrobacteraceae bacterium]